MVRNCMLFSIAFFLILCGCRSAIETVEKEEPALKISAGMTKEEVLRILGNPDFTSSSNDETIFFYCPNLDNYDSQSKCMPIFLKEKRRASSEPRQIRKYMRYAIGEVILLVIGILIALQINNWNDERKDRKKERFYLQTLKGSIQNSKLELTRVFEDSNAGYMATDSLLNLIAFDQIPPVHVFDSLLRWSSDYSIYSAGFPLKNLRIFLSTFF